MLIIYRTVDPLDRRDPHPYQKGRFLVWSPAKKHYVWAVW